MKRKKSRSWFAKIGGCLIAVLLIFPAIGGLAGNMPKRRTFVRASENTAGWYWGDGHTHSNFSDGTSTVAENVQSAKGKGLSFLVATDHDTVAQKDAVSNIGEADFLAVSGIEISTVNQFGYAHMLAYGALGEEVWGEYGKLRIPEQAAIDRVKELGGISYLAHPCFSGYTWNKNVQGFDGIEVWNPDLEVDKTGNGYTSEANRKAFEWWDELNRAGRHIYGTANTDAHAASFVGNVKIKAFMDDLSEASYYKAMKNGTFFGSNGPELTFAAGSTMMGGDYQAGAAAAPVSLSVGGSWTHNISKAELLVNGEVAKTWTPGATSFSENFTLNVSEGDFARLTIETEQSGFAYSNPIFFTDKIGNVNDKIAAIPARVTLADKQIVEEADRAYRALSEEEQAQVADAQKLFDAIAAMEAMDARAQAVIAKIEEIPAIVTFADREKVAEARTAYDALGDGEKVGVSNYGKLTSAEAVIDASENDIQAVIAGIEEITATTTLADQAKVTAVRAAYDALTEDEKQWIPNYAQLIASEAAIGEMAVKALAVIDKIGQIPAKVTLADKPIITAARSAYDTLRSGEKAGITNYRKLTLAESALAALEKENGGDGEKPSGGCQKSGITAFFALTGAALAYVFFKKGRLL